MRHWWLVALVAACGQDAKPIDPTPNWSREIIDTKLTFDFTARTGTAKITFGPSTAPGATLEVGDLSVDPLMTPTGDYVPSAVTNAKMDLGLPASKTPLTVDATFAFNYHEGFTGASKNGFTLLWPYYCGNLFPCHSQPGDGPTFT